jgi:hypothetical protein
LKNKNFGIEIQSEYGIKTKENKLFATMSSLNSQNSKEKL